MRHAFIDQYSPGTTIIHRIDPRIKIISLFIFILFVVSTPINSFLNLTLYGILILSLILISKIPLGFIFKRVLVIIPFVVILFLFVPFFKEGVIIYDYSIGPLKIKVSYEGLQILINGVIKACLSILCMLLLISSTEFSLFLKAAERLKCPKIMVIILSFMYRYIFVVQDGLLKMWQAKEARSIGRSGLFQIKALANMIGTLFIKTYERAENVYLAMCARGFDGNIRTIDNFKLKREDISFLLIIILLVVSIRLV